MHFYLTIYFKIFRDFAARLICTAVLFLDLNDLFYLNPMPPQGGIKGAPFQVEVDQEKL